GSIYGSMTSHHYSLRYTRQVLCRAVSQSGGSERRLLRWAVELNEFEAPGPGGIHRFSMPAGGFPKVTWSDYWFRWQRRSFDERIGGAILATGAWKVGA